MHFLGEVCVETCSKRLLLFAYRGMCTNCLPRQRQTQVVDYTLAILSSSVHATLYSSVYATLLCGSAWQASPNTCSPCHGFATSLFYLSLSKDADLIRLIRSIKLLEISAILS
jgi:hypothetical protein